MPKPIPRHQNQPPNYNSFEVMSKNVYFWSKKWPFWKKDLWQFKLLYHLKACMPKPIPRHQNQPPSYNSLEVRTKNVYSWSKKRPFWKIQTSDSFKNYIIGKPICQNISLDTKISLLAIIVLKLWAKMQISSHVTKNAINRPFWIFLKL